MNLNDVCSSLSQLTKDSWEAASNSIIRKSDGLELWFRIGGYGNVGKAAIHFCRPVGRDGRSPTLWGVGNGKQIGNPEIGVSDKKSADQIANDIVRRLLPEAEVVFKLANESIADTNKYLDGKVKTTLEIAALCGTEPKRLYNSPDLSFEIDPFTANGVAKFGKCGYGKITISSEDCVNIELTSVGLDVAREIISALNKILSSKK